MQLPTAPHSSVGLRSRMVAFIVLAGCHALTRPVSAALPSGVYQTAPGTTVQEFGDRLREGSRTIPLTATVTFDLQDGRPNLTAVMADAVLEGGDPFALTVCSSSGAQYNDSTYLFTGDYLRNIEPSGTQYLFDWKFRASPDGQVVWNGITGWAGGHIWQITISNVVLVPVPRLSISLEGNAAFRITWATNFTDHVLEYTASFPAASWRIVTEPVTVTGGHFAVTVDSIAAQRFYRLRKP
jgi:hypothetical protein